MRILRADESRPANVVPARAAPALMLFLVLLAPTAGGAGDVFPFLFGADGEQEVPPVATVATGGCYAVLDEPAMQVNITCAHSVVGATAAHIHAGPAGSAGPIVFDLGDPSTSPFFAIWNGLSPQDIADLHAGGFYVNIHSKAHPGGEIRGQILPRAVGDLVFFPDESQVVPPTGSLATAGCTAELSDMSFNLTVTCDHDVVEPTAAHVHRAAVGANGPLLFDLGDPTAPLTETVFMLPPDLAEYVAGLLYLDVHSAAFPDGEIRGQLVQEQIFADGFESGDTTAWSATLP